METASSSIGCYLHDSHDGGVGGQCIQTLGLRGACRGITPLLTDTAYASTNANAVTAVGALKDGETSGRTCQVIAAGGDKQSSAAFSEIELANTIGQASVESSAEVRRSFCKDSALRCASVCSRAPLLRRHLSAAAAWRRSSLR